MDKTIFDGDTINTPSMLCVEDYLDALEWAGRIGLRGLIARSRANLKTIEAWVEKTDWIDSWPSPRRRDRIHPFASWSKVQSSSRWRRTPRRRFSRGSREGSARKGLHTTSIPTRTRLQGSASGAGRRLSLQMSLPLSMRWGRRILKRFRSCEFSQGRLFLILMYLSVI